MIPRACASLVLSLAMALASLRVAGLGAQDELRQRQKEIAESELKYLADKAKAEGKTSVTFTRGVHRELIPWSPQNRLAHATILAATATSITETLFYQPPLTFWTLLSFAVDEEIAGKVAPTGNCRHVAPTPPPANHVWIPIFGGSRNVAGIVISHDAGWPLPVAGRRYVLIGERCSMELMELTFGPEDLYELSGDQLRPNPSDTEYVRYVNNLGTLSKLRQMLETFR